MHMLAKAVQEDLEPHPNRVVGLAKLIAERALLDALLRHVPHFRRVLKK